jgi:hypothetical protein
MAANEGSREREDDSVRLWTVQEFRVQSFQGWGEETKDSNFLFTLLTYCQGVVPCVPQTTGYDP